MNRYSVSKGSCEKRLGLQVIRLATGNREGGVLDPKSTCKASVASPRPQRQIPEKRLAVTASSGYSMGISKAASDCEYFGSDCRCLGAEVPGYFSEIQSHCCFSHWQIIYVLLPTTHLSIHWQNTYTCAHTLCLQELYVSVSFPGPLQALGQPGPSSH